MAKSLRSSRRKSNRSNLRTKVFAPVEDARTERLSAKLLETASTNPDRTPAQGDMTMSDSNTIEQDSATGNQEEATHEEAMDVDAPSVESRKKRHQGPKSTRIKKRRKAKNAIVFPSTGRKIQRQRR